jgi:hypothetical protein
MTTSRGDREAATVPTAHELGARASGTANALRVVFDRGGDG